MELFINVTKIKELELDPNEYCFLAYVYKKLPFEFEVSESFLDHLENKKFIKNSAEGIVLREKGLTLFKENTSPGLVNDWIEDWRNLWPSGVKAGSRLVKGDKNGCLTKMKTFVKRNPEYTKEQIIEATRLYLFERKLANWFMITSADYFIEKNGVSMLAAELENLEGKESQLKQLESGSDSWQKEI